MIAALVGVIVVAVLYAVEVVPAWQHRSQPPEAPSELGEGGGLNSVMVHLLLLALLFGCGLVAAVVTLVLAVVAYLRKEWKPATLALSILAVTIIAYLIALQIPV